MAWHALTMVRCGRSDEATTWVRQLARLWPNTEAAEEAKPADVDQQTSRTRWEVVRLQAFTWEGKAEMLKLSTVSQMS